MAAITIIGSRAYLKGREARGSHSWRFNIQSETLNLNPKPYTLNPNPKPKLYTLSPPP